jgi:hypothetical protein
MTYDNGIDLFEACRDLHVIRAIGRTAFAWTKNRHGRHVTSWSLTGIGNNQLVTVFEVLSLPLMEYRILSPDGILTVDVNGVTEWRPLEGEPRPATVDEIEDAIELVTHMAPYPAINAAWIYRSSDGMADALVWAEPSATAVQEPEFKVVVRADNPKCAQVASTLAGMNPERFWQLADSEILFAGTHGILTATEHYARLWEISGPGIEPSVVFCDLGFDVVVSTSQSHSLAISVPTRGLFLHLSDLAAYSDKAIEIVASYPTRRLQDLVATGSVRPLNARLRAIMYQIPGPDGGDPLEAPPTTDLSSDRRPALRASSAHAGAEPVFCILTKPNRLFTAVYFRACFVT